jgi:prepilin-type N-terminal cleavage/methylation domain-containing protein/prepilin-type processing-associated H-X9-DG protein
MPARWPRPSRRPSGRRAFSLIELVVVIGIIAVLIGIILPALHRARMSALSLKCRANLHSIGQSLLIYANNNAGWIYPPNHGAIPGRALEDYWPNLVFKPAIWNPPILLCPADENPALECSYLLNHYLRDKQIRFHTKVPGKPSSDIIVMGEKRTETAGYYLDPGEYDAVVEPFRHGRTLKSNYLYMDLHVDNNAGTQVINGIEPWDVPEAPAPQPQ